MKTINFLFAVFLLITQAAHAGDLCGPSNDAIRVTQAGAGRLRFEYCSDRSKASSCELIGNRTYNERELHALGESLWGTGEKYFTLSEGLFLATSAVSAALGAGTIGLKIPAWIPIGVFGLGISGGAVSGYISSHYREKTILLIDASIPQYRAAGECSANSKADLKDYRDQLADTFSLLDAGNFSVAESFDPKAVSAAAESAAKTYASKKAVE